MLVHWNEVDIRIVVDRIAKPEVAVEDHPFAITADAGSGDFPVVARPERAVMHQTPRLGAIDAYQEDLVVAMRPQALPIAR